MNDEERWITMLPRELARRRLPPTAWEYLRAMRYRLLYRRLRLSYASAGTWAGVRSRPRVLFYPELPRPNTIVYRLCAALGYAISNDPSRPCDLALKWENATESQMYAPLARLARTQRVVNLGCNDISKVRVGEAFAAAFGYTLTVDPGGHDGQFVEKSDINASHDGRIVSGPLTAPRDGYVYQRLIDNRTDDDHVIDMRVPIIGSSLPLVYLRCRPVERRFRSGNLSVRIVHLYDQFDQDEVSAIRRFCELLELDYGELDVLRDRADGRIYVVDANNTPFGPPSGIDGHDGERAVRLLVAAFAAEFMGPSR